MFDIKYTEIHDNRKMANLIKRHKLFEKEHRSSRFENNAFYILEGDEVRPMGDVTFIKVSHFSTVVCRVDKKPVGLLVLEHYIVNDTIDPKFTLNNKKRRYTMIGLVGTYVKPEFRKKGIGHAMMSVLNEQLQDLYVSDDTHVHMLAATGKTFDLVQAEMPSFCPVVAPYNSNKWKDTAKSWYTYSRHHEGMVEFV
jgi:GNAT superfamily N-acetyltransferase